MSEAPIIKPIKLHEFACKQSKYDPHVGKLPMRSLLLGPSGSGKGILLQNMVLDIHKGWLEQVFSFSPIIKIDHTWIPVIKHLTDDVGMDSDKTFCV